MATIATLVVDVKANTTGLQKVGAAMTKYVTLPIVGGMAVAVKEFTEFAKVNAQTEAVLESTGGAANVTQKHVQELSNSIGELAVMEGETIQQGANMLLTFTKIQNLAGKGNDIFDQSVKILTDMSVALGRDMTTTAIQLGKALQDPILGVTALRRVGVNLDDQAKEMIDTWVEQGNILKAQKFILAELTTEFGGSAAAVGAAAGPMERLKVAALEMAESFGAVLSPIIQKVSSIFVAFANFLRNLSPPMRNVVLGALALVAVIGPLILIGIKLAGAFRTVGVAFLALTRLMKANPYLLLIAATVALVVLIIKNWDKIKAALIAAWNKIATSAQQAWNNVKNAVMSVVGPIVNAIETIIDAVQRAIQWLERMLNIGRAGIGAAGGIATAGGARAPISSGTGFPSIVPKLSPVTPIQIAGDVIVESDTPEEFASELANVRQTELSRRGLG